MALPGTWRALEALSNPVALAPEMWRVYERGTWRCIGGRARSCTVHVDVCVDVCGMCRVRRKTMSRAVARSYFFSTTVLNLDHFTCDTATCRLLHTAKKRVAIPQVARRQREKPCFGPECRWEPRAAGDLQKAVYTSKGESRSCNTIDCNPCCCFILACRCCCLIPAYRATLLLLVTV